VTFNKNEIQLPDRIAEYLAEKIIRMEFKPGQRIPEANLAQELNVSRGSVREALHILNKQFLVEFFPRRGAVVANLSVKFVEDLYDALNALYIFLAETGLPKVTRSDLDQLTPFLKLMEEYADKSDPEGFYDCMLNFTLACMKIVGNQVVEQILLNLWKSKGRIEFATLYRRKEILKEISSFFIKGTKYYLEGRFDLVEKCIRDLMQKEKELAVLLAREFEQNNTGRD
jgi:DNA-binding GntR family transcriptional regulator